ncbi:MAG: heavy metal-responsive transcriptional regulator [Gemmatimonadaceae bacterium]
MGSTMRQSGAMLAGDVARVLGVGVQTLHYYEREGLVPRAQRSESGYRIYTPQLVERIRFIRKAKALGLPLDKVRDILRLSDSEASPCGSVRNALTERLDEVDRRLAALQEFRDELAGLVDRAERTAAVAEGGMICAIVEDAPALSASDFAAAPLVRRRRGGEQPRRQR